MFTVSKEAVQAIAAFFEENPDESRVLRVYISPGTCNGPMLSITTDQVDPTDVSEEVCGVTYCMDRNLMERTGTLTIELDSMGGLTIRPEHSIFDASVFAACSCGCGAGACSGESECSEPGCAGGCCSGSH